MTGKAHRPRVKLSQETSEVVDDAIHALAVQGRLLERGHALVEVLVDDRDPTPGEHPAAARASVATVHRVLELAESAARWVDVKLVEDEWEEFDTRPTQRIIQTLLDRRQWSGIPALKGITETPFPRLDGDIVSATGFDATTGYFLAGRVTPRVHADVGLDDAQASYTALLDVLSDFPFEADGHAAAAVGAILTLIARPTIAGPVPMVIVTSSTPGSGKSLLVDVIHEIAVGRSLSRTPYPGDEAELEKRVTSILMAGHAAVCIDNVDGAFGSPTLDALLTSTEWMGRMLGRSEMVLVPARSVWIATGNNIRLKGDLARRVLPIRVEANVERPEERDGFKIPKIIEYIREHRDELVGHALTILRAYCRAGRPPPAGSYGSFEAWSSLVRGALVWLGAPDPLVVARTWAEDADEQREAFIQLGAAWVDVVGKGPVLLGDLAELSEGVNGRPLREALRVVAGKGQHVDYALLGNRLRRQKGRWWGRYQWTTTEGRTGGSRRWKVVVRDG